MACRTNRGGVIPQSNGCASHAVSSCSCNAYTIQYKPFTKTFYSEKIGWQTRIGSWNYPTWAVRYLAPAQQRIKNGKKC